MMFSLTNFNIFLWRREKKNDTQNRTKEREEKRQTEQNERERKKTLTDYWALD
jgi:hypothetical protein